MCHIHPPYVFFYWYRTSVQTFRAIGQLFMDILHWGIHEVLSRMQFGCLSSHWQCVYVPSDALPLFQILKQSDNWSWRYCISKIWGIQKVSSRMQLVLIQSLPRPRRGLRGIVFSRSVCLSVCLANILVFYFSAIRRDIDLKFIQDTYRVVLNSLKKLTFIGQRKNWDIEKFHFFFIDTSYDTLFNETIKTWASREMTSQKNTSIFDFNM